MKKYAALRLSFWAKSHRPAAIALIVVSKIAIGIIGLCLGTWTAVEGLAFPLETKWLLAAVAVASMLAYPAKRLKKRLGRAMFYRRQKAADGVLVGLGFFILFFAGNLAPVWVAAPHEVINVSANVPTALSCIEKPVAEARKEFVHSGKLSHWMITKVKAKAAKAIARLVRTADGADAAVKILMSILLVLAALSLAYVVYALSCSLACAGQESLAVLLAVVGGVGIVVGLIFAIKAVWGNSGNHIDDRHRKRPPTR